MADTRTTESGNGGGIVGRVKQSATQQLTSQKDRAADGIGSVTQALRQSTQHLRDQQHETIAKYVEQAADHVDRWCDQLRSKDVTEVFGDVQRLARRQPAVFVGSAFALGLIGARFLKSSSDEVSHQRTSGGSRREYRGSMAISEAADARHTTSAVSVSDVEAAIEPPEYDAAAPAPGGGAGASTRTRRTTSEPGERSSDRTDRSTRTERTKS